MSSKAFSLRYCAHVLHPWPLQLEGLFPIWIAGESVPPADLWIRRYLGGEKVTSARKNSSFASGSVSNGAAGTGGAVNCVDPSAWSARHDLRRKALNGPDLRAEDRAEESVSLYVRCRSKGGCIDDFNNPTLACCIWQMF